MNKQTAEQAAKGLRKVMDGKLILQKVLMAIEEDVKRVRPGSPLEEISIGLDRAIKHLGQAVVDIPNALWANMLGFLEDLPLEELEESSRAA